MVGPVLVLLMAVGCGRAQHADPTTRDSFAVTLATEPAAAVVGDGAVLIALHDAAGQPVDGAQLAIEANMSHAGMTPVTASGQGSQEGVYRVPLRWTMAGDWYVDVTFTLADGTKLARRFPLNVR